jgi:acyl-CoA synthetase (AMP-forming)/AMP-acid ligase II
MRAQTTSTVTTLVELARRRAQNTPDELIYAYSHTPKQDSDLMTYAQLDARAAALAAHLQAICEPGARVILLLEAGLDFVVSFFACLYAGLIAVPVPVRPRLLIRDIEHVAMDSGASAVVSSRTLPVLIEEGSSGLLRRLPEVLVHAISGAAPDQWQPPQIRFDNIAFLQYTSGSTGSPKAVLVGHGNLIDNLGFIHQKFRINTDSRAVIWLPPYHDMGLIGGILSPLYSGFPVLLMSSLTMIHNPLNWLKAIAQFRGTISGGPNFGYELCLRRCTSEAVSGLDLSSWSVAFVGAEPVRPHVLKSFAECFAPAGFKPESFFPVYGMAESTLLISAGEVGAGAKIFHLDREDLKKHKATITTPGAEHSIRFVGCGSQGSNNSIHVVDPDTLELCPEMQVGEIWLQGPSVAQGYWCNKDATNATFAATLKGGSPEKYLRTSDLGFLMNGELVVTGRLKDVIIIRGRNYYPEDLEATVQESHPSFKAGKSVVFTIGDYGEELIVIQEARPNLLKEGTLPDLQVAIRQAISVQHGLEARQIRFVAPGSILRTTSGKLRRRATKELFVKGGL